jgi:hypothetical protein|eukprot:3178299-Prymnesium_polylepis.1
MGATLDDIEVQLTEAAALYLVGTVNPSMYAIMVKGRRSHVFADARGSSAPLGAQAPLKRWYARSGACPRV